jgi:phage shock protein C
MKKLYRSRTDIMIAGVCGGLAKYLDVDPTAVRLVFVLLSFLALGGFWVYVILWIIMPVEPEAGTESVEVEAKTKPQEEQQFTGIKPINIKKPAKTKPENENK